MSNAPRPKLPRSKGPHYLLRLFIAGNGPNSSQALANVRRLCRERLSQRCTVEVVDVVKDFEAAVRNNILVTPALLRVAPTPRVLVLGNLNDREKVFVALGLQEDKS